MKIRPEILDHWPEVSARLPADFDLEATARLRGDFRRAREIKNAETLLRLALAYGGLGMSLRETCAGGEGGGGPLSPSRPSLARRRAQGGALARRHRRRADWRTGKGAGGTLGRVSLARTRRDLDL